MNKPLDWQGKGIQLGLEEETLQKERHPKEPKKLISMIVYH